MLATNLPGYYHLFGNRNIFQIGKNFRLCRQYLEDSTAN